MFVTEKLLGGHRLRVKLRDEDPWTDRPGTQVFRVYKTLKHKTSTALTSRVIAIGVH